MAEPTDKDRIRQLELEVQELRRGTATVLAYLVNLAGGSRSLEIIRARGAGALVSGGQSASAETLYRMIEEQL